MGSPLLLQTVEKIESADWYTVKWFNLEKGYGFLLSANEDSQDVFIHFSMIKEENVKNLQTGDKLLCSVKSNMQGKEVSKVYQIESNRAGNIDAGNVQPVEVIRSQVKWFHSVRGYGFLEPFKGSRDIFITQKTVKEANRSSLQPGEILEVQIQTTERGPEAIAILDNKQKQG